MKCLALFLFAAPLMAGPLPTIGKQPWLVQYVAYEHKQLQFTINSEGVGQLLPMNEKGKPLDDKHAIKFLPVVEDVSADGKAAAKYIQKDGWEAVTPAGVNAKTVTYRGTAGGNSRFEITLEFDGKEVRAGGKILDKGTLINPRFRLRVQVPNIYLYDKDPDLSSLYERITLGKEEDPGPLIRNRFGARYVFSDNTHHDFFDHARASGWFDIVYEDTQCTIMYIRDQKLEENPLGEP